MTTISVNTTVDQNWVETNTTPWTINTGITVTFGSHLRLYSLDHFIMNNNSVIDGAGYKVYRITTSSYAVAKPVGSNTTGMVIKDFGVILSTSGTTLDQYEGAVYSSYVFPGFQTGCEISIYRCYSIGEINGVYTSGIAGTFGNGGICYLYDCFHIGTINETATSTAAGIIGGYAGYSGVCFIMNCYNIGTVITNGGSALIGPYPAYTNGKFYMINCYYSDGNYVVGSYISGTEVYFGYNHYYDYSGSWNDTTAINNLYTSISGGTTLQASNINNANFNYTKISGSASIPVQADLTAYDTYLSGLQSSPYYSYIQFPSTSGVPFGIQHFYVAPYVTNNYLTAIDEPASTAVITTNTNINQTWVNSNNSPWLISDNVVVTVSSNITLTSLQYFIMKNNSRIQGRGFKFLRTSSNNFPLVIPYENSILLTIQQVGVICSSGGTELRVNNGVICSPYDFYTTTYRNNLTIYIRNSYSVSILDQNNCGGIIGSCGIGGTYYIHDCYHIGTISNFTCGGITGSNFGSGAGIGFIVNCYYIGTNSAGAGSIVGNQPAFSSGYCYLINVYYTSGSYIRFGGLVGTENYVGYNSEYDGSSWSDATALTSLYSQESGGTTLTSSAITTTGNYSKVSGSLANPDSTQLSNYVSYLNSTGQSSPYYSYFKFASLTNQPWGLTYFTIFPYYPQFYTQATDEPNCFCKGTKITTINEDNVKVYIEIEKMRKGMVVVTPHGVNKRVLHIGRFWYSGSKPKHMAHLIPKDYFTKGVPFEDTYCSGAHSLMYNKNDGNKIGLKNGRQKERSNGMDLYLIKNFGEIQDFHKVSAIKGESGKPYGFYYYHLVIEDNYGFYANGMQSESLEMKDFIANFEEV